MSLDDNLKTLGKLLSKEQVAAIKRAARQRARELKFQRKVQDALARGLLRQHFVKDPKTGKKKWDSKRNNAIFRGLMARRHAIHNNLFRLVGEKKDPEFDSP